MFVNIAQNINSLEVLDKLTVRMTPAWDLHSVKVSTYLFLSNQRCLYVQKCLQLTCVETLKNETAVRFNNVVWY